jgi:hypothetical protein
MEDFKMTVQDFERSELTNRIVNYMKMHDKGANVSYRDISNGVGHKVKEDTPRLISARRVLEREHQQVWVAIRPRVGLHRLTDIEIAERLRRWWLPGAKRKLQRGGQQGKVVETGNLDIDEQARFGVDSLQRELALQTLSRSSWNRLEKVARGTSNDLPQFNILEWAINLMPKNKEPPV